MKKLSILIASLLTLTLLLCSAALADTITAMVTEINPDHQEKVASYARILAYNEETNTITVKTTEINSDHLENVVSYARILAYNEETNTLTVELIVPEVFVWEDKYVMEVEVFSWKDEQGLEGFSWEDEQGLEEGDSIDTGGLEVVIESNMRSDWEGFPQINNGAVMPSKLYDGSGDYAAEADYGESFWNTLAVIECPVTERLLFLDSINDETGDMLELPIVLSADELVSKLLSEQMSDEYRIGLAQNNVYVVFDGEGNLALIHRFYIPWQ